MEAHKENAMQFITFSRKMGTRGTEIAKVVAEKLNYHFYDTEQIEKAAEDIGVLDDIRKVDEKAPSPLMKLLFSSKHEIHLDRLYLVIYQLASLGSAVILGRGGNMLFRSLPYALHVRVIASTEKRISNIMASGYDRDAGIRVMERSDHERGNFARFVFHRDWASPEAYDLVLSMDKLNVNTAVDVVLHAARSEEVRGCARDVKTCLDMMQLALRVETAFAESGLHPGHVQAFVDSPGRVRLTGVVQVPWEKSAAERVAREVDGGESIENRIQTSGR